MSQKKFKLFDFTKDGKGVSKAETEDIKPNLSGFFKQYKNKFSRLLSVNIFMVLGNFPLFFAGLALAGVLWRNPQHCAGIGALSDRLRNGEV